MRVHLADKPWKQSKGLHPTYIAHNNDPNGGAWTGFDDILAQLDAGVNMAAGVGILPVDHWQHDRYRHFQNACIERGGERRPPSPHGPGALHLHIERTRAAEVWE
jgi:hypothetical protein